MIYACGPSPRKVIEIDDFTSSLGINELYKSDQGDRQVLDIDWPLLLARDKQRMARAYELLDSSKVITSEDFANAAMIFQHGIDTISSGMAVKLMQKAIELDPTRDKSLLAKAIDRDLMFKYLPQIYGTQYTKKSKNAPWERYSIDTTKITDIERRKYGVETISEQIEKLRAMNSKTIS